MLTPRVALLVPLLLLLGCADSHGRHSDGGADAAVCGPSPLLFCVSACGSDAGYAPICADGVFRCPPGTVDIATCPPGCVGPPPTGCFCEGTEWVCEDDRCPADLDPWNPDAPGSACRVEGASCTGGSGDSCGAGIWCTCEAGRWNCAIAEPDPVCWCGREPSEGDRCSEEGASCGECCPSVDGTGWPAMQCVGGHWTAADCPAVICPVVVPECPVDTASVIGTACGFDMQRCGNACCGTAITCVDGRWEHGPDAACACTVDAECGAGTCPAWQSCHQRCGPDDGLEFRCVALPEGCNDCDCTPLEAWETCEMVDGHPYVSDGGFCG